MSFADRWKNASADGDERFDPPDGPYHVRITDGGAFAGGDGREWVKVTLEILDGEHKGKQFDDFNGIDNEFGMSRVKTNLALYGFNIDAVEELDDIATGIIELIGTTADVTVRHSSKGFVNVSVNRVITGQSDIPNQQGSFDTSDFEPAAAKPRGAYDEADDEIPF